MGHKEVNSLFDIMHVASKAVIVIPILIIVVAVALQLNQRLSYIHTVPMPIASPTAPYTPTPSRTAQQASLNLKGPFSCAYRDKEASVSAYIKDSNISLTFTKTQAVHILVNGDCAYKWNQGAISGQSYCGISHYLSFLELMSSMGKMDMSTLVSMLQMSDQTELLPSDAFMQNVINSCVKQEVSASVFTVPPRISFKKTNMDQTNGSNTSNDNSLFNLPFLKF